MYVQVWMDYSQYQKDWTNLLLSTAFPAIAISTVFNVDTHILQKFKTFKERITWSHATCLARNRTFGSYFSVDRKLLLEYAKFLEWTKQGILV